jgi:hypothetical protein
MVMSPTQTKPKRTSPQQHKVMSDQTLSKPSSSHLQWHRRLINWLFSLYPIETKPIDPVETLYRSIHITSKCRFNASIRLKRLGSFSFTTGTVLSLGLILLPMLQLSDLNLLYPKSVINILQVFLAVAALVYSVINATAHYETRSFELNQCGDNIKELSRELRSTSDAHAVIDTFNKRYTEISTRSENHTRRDYWLTMLQATEVYRITGFPRLLLYVKTQSAHLLPYAIPALLIMIEFIIICDNIGVTSILTGAFNGLMARQP